jgi:hypothetical protein
MGRGRRPLPSSFKNQTIKNKENKMKKTLLALLSIAIAFTAIAPAQAQDERVLAIIDSAINSNNFKSIVHEVCYTTVKSSVPTQNMSCPNGELFMEGKGAASAAWPLQRDAKTKLPIPGMFDHSSGTFHGDQMVKSALTVNPNLKIVFIRVNNITNLGAGSTPADGQTILKALEWVTANASKYSIDAVSVSIAGITTLGRVQSLHPGCTTPSILNPFTSQVSQLNAANIPTFVATGNHGSRTLVGFPACVPGVIGVGGLVDKTDRLDPVTNSGPGLDMVETAKVSITRYNGSPSDSFGTSVSTALVSAKYVNTNTFKTFGEYLNSLKKVLINNVSYIRN